jgi:CPA2 family monovalent cation:H+ antiporter-2
MVVGGIVAAFVLGFIAHKLGISPIVGYLSAGVLIGPYTPGFVGDVDMAGELAELGVILIMFGMGLKFSPEKLAERRWVALPCAFGQLGLVTLLGLALGRFIGLETIEALIFGFCLSVASTIVLLRTLDDQRLSASPAGQLAMCWLIVQDLTAVFVVVAMPIVSHQVSAATFDGHALVRAIGVKSAELSLFAIIMLVVGRRILPAFLVFIARARSRELFSLGVFAFALGIAFAAHKIFGATFALGAFVAGMVLNEAELSHRAAEDLTPLRDAFAVLFFVSVGMLFDPRIIVTQTWTVLAVLAVVIAGNGGAVWLMTTLLKLPVAQKLVLASGLAQIGEFSFLISGFGLSLGLISEQTHVLITAGALLAITLNPVVQKAVQLAGRWRRAPSAAAESA